MDDQRTNRDVSVRPPTNSELLRIGAVILALLMIAGAVLSDMHGSLICGGLVIGGSLIFSAVIIASAIANWKK
jgi:hypothetical protein